jgi:phosphomannomutase
MNDLKSHLTFEPPELRFGTSGRRGLITDLTQLEVYINALAELEYLNDPGVEVYFACDLRPSSPRLAEAIVQAIHDAGKRPVNLGFIPTPALTAYALRRGCGSIMVTGSHIPFDRNGYKTNSARGELLKEQEGPIGEQVRAVRKRVYAQNFHTSPFDQSGSLRKPPRMPAVDQGGAAEYLERYTRFFPPRILTGMRLLVYQHSAVGRDLLVEALERLGATVTPAGRSGTFVPIDTENIDAEQLATIRDLVAGRDFDAVVSTDGDSDRPLLLGLDHEDLRFFGGDLLGMIVAQYLGADAVVVPVSCNDAIDLSPLARVLEPKTRIGSPYVIAGMIAAAGKGRSAVCGWEANGGFLTGSDITREGRTLPALPTRDAFLPLLAVLASAQDRGVNVCRLFDELPRRFGRAGLLKNFPRSAGLRLTEALSADPTRFFTDVAAVDRTDGPRITFRNGEVIHIRPSGNADELRIYAVADTPERAGAMVAEGLAEPGGLLRRLERETA